MTLNLIKLFQESKAPLGLKLITVYYLVLAVSILANVLLEMLVLPTFQRPPSSSFGDLFVEFTPVVPLVFAALYMYLAYGLLKVTRRAILWTLSLAQLAVIFTLLYFFQGAAPTDLYEWATVFIDLAVAGYMLYYTKFFTSPFKLHLPAS